MATNTGFDPLGSMGNAVQRYAPIALVAGFVGLITSGFVKNNFLRMVWFLSSIGLAGIGGYYTLSGAWTGKGYYTATPPFSPMYNYQDLQQRYY